MKVGYCRVSTGEQEDALVQQVSRIQKAGVVKIYQDIESGKSDKRKQLNALLTDIKTGLITELVITRIDRLARNLINFNKTFNLLETHKVKLTILDSPVDDPSSPFGWYSINLMAQAAEFELRMIQSRIKHGYVHCREQNKASSKPPFGYMRVDEKYTLDTRVNEYSNKANWEVARDIVDYFINNKTTLRSTISYIYNTYKLDWSTPGLKHWLNNLVLQGDTCYNIKGNQRFPERWDIRPNTHKPLISREEGQIIKNQLQENKKKWGHNTGKKVGSWLLSGQVVCGDCGYKCFLYSKRSTMPLRCRKRNHYGADFCSNKTVTHLQKVIDAVDDALIQKAQDLVNYVSCNVSTIKENPVLTQKQNLLTSLKQIPSDDPTMLEAIQKLTLEIQQLQLENSKVNNLNQEQLNLFLKYFKDRNYWIVIPDDLKSEVYKLFVNKVVILNGNIIKVELIDIF